jgi:pimeloyl-ACP methyl ester carboxylesterase
MRILTIFLLTAIALTSCQDLIDKHMHAGKHKQNTDSTKGYAPVNGIKMYYEIHGQGEPLVLIHGGGSTIGTTFGNIRPLLAKNFKVIAVELQAHGHTSDRDAPESFQQDADDVAALLAYLKIDKANIFGFSNGGSTALQIGIRHPEIVNKIIAASAVYKREGMFNGFFEMMDHASLANMPKPLQDAYLAINNDQKGLQNMHDKDKMRMINFKDWPDQELASMKIPVMIFISDKDAITIDHAKKMTALIPGAQMKIFPGMHGAFIGEVCTATGDPKTYEETAKAIVDFLK